MKYRLLAIIAFLVLPAVAAAPRSYVSTCDVQTRIRDGRDPEGPVIPGQSADLILHRMTNEELARIIRDFAKGHAERTDWALDALRHAKQVRPMLTPEVVMQETVR